MSVRIVTAPWMASADHAGRGIRQSSTAAISGSGSRMARQPRVRPLATPRKLRQTGQANRCQVPGGAQPGSSSLATHLGLRPAGTRGPARRAQPIDNRLHWASRHHPEPRSRGPPRSLGCWDRPGDRIGSPRREVHPPASGRSGRGVTSPGGCPRRTRSATARQHQDQGPPGPCRIAFSGQGQSRAATSGSPFSAVVAVPEPSSTSQNPSPAGSSFHSPRPPADRQRPLALV